MARPEWDIGRLDPGIRLEGVTLVLRPSPERQAALEALLADQRDPASPRYHAWLTPEQFGERFGLAAADLGRVSAWLRSRGLAVTGVSRSRNQVSFGGSAGSIEAALRTELHRYAAGGAVHFANATAISLPTALAPLVAGVRNLDDFRPRPRVHRPAEPAFTSSISGNHFLAPGDVATIYDVSALYAAGLDGSGESIAVVGQSALDPADVAAFRAAAGLAPNAPQLVLVPSSGTSTVVAGDVEEASLDVEWSGAVARSARIVFVYTGNSASFNVWDALQYAVTNDVAPVISMSYGFCEQLTGSTTANVFRGWAQQANAQGQTISASAGDAGAADCESVGAATASHGLAVDLPAALPEVTGVGGTTLSGDASNPGAFWSATNGAGAGSALGYIPETVWNDTALEGVLAAGGGGASAFFPKPSWQVGSGVPADGRRDVPDLSLAASAVHDGYLICVQGSCVSGFRAADSTLTVVGGTSAGAPSFAGMLALLDQATGGHGLGNVNPQLYALAQTTPGAFHPITSGSNIVPCQPSSTDCPAASPFQLGFAAGPGYDQAAGLGSVDAGALVAAWTASLRAATQTTLSASATSSPVGQDVTFTASVTSVAPGAAPTGTVVFLSDAQPLGAEAALSGGQASITTGALPAGVHAVTAAYSGDASHLPSTSAAVSVTVGSVVSVTGPATVTPPRGGLTFTASGGSGTGYVWSLLTNASGGAVSGGRYTAGPAGNVVDVIRVVDSQGNAGGIDVTVTAGVTITPGIASVAVGGTIAFSAQGGSGTGFSWALATDLSGGAVNAATGAYAAGPTGGVMDVVAVTDSLGNTASRNVTVTPPAQAASAPSPSGGGCGSSGGGSALPSLLALGLWLGRRRAGSRGPPTP
ncbi:MAG TPA: protease pro-enzyme activation domain-containing protein [Anaeromyxobacter sp.]|nr:protease pro-enzyme activation domain-containing protein [Anaeromyxobacter sp.]